MFNQFFLILGLAVILSSCGGLQRIGINKTSEIIYSASFDIESESNWENFEKAVLPNLKMAEGMLSLEPTNLDLLATLTKGYAGYALAINETLFMNDLYSGKLESLEQNQAIANYSKALEYGLRYLEQKSVTYAELGCLMNEEGQITLFLEKNLSKNLLRDKELVLYTAMSLSSLVNLQKNRSFLVAQVPVGKQMMDWVCTQDPEIAGGACGLFYGSLESSRPKSLGGNPEKGKEYFLKVIANFPENYLARIFYIQHYIIPNMEENLFKEQMSFLEEAEKVFNESWRWAPQKVELTQKQKRLRLYQAIAFKRFRILKNHEKELF